MLGRRAQLARIIHDNLLRAHAHVGLDGGHGALRHLVVGLVAAQRALHGHLVLAGEVLLVHADGILAGQALQPAYHKLDVGGEHVHGAHDEHLVLAPGHVDTRQRAPALARVGGHVADVARAEADHGTRLLHERGVHQLARLARCQHLAGRRVHRLHEYLVLHDMQAVVRLARGGAGTVDVGQAVEVHDLRTPEVLDALARRRDGAARLAGHDDGVDVEIGARVVALLLRHLAQVPRVGRRRPDDGRLVLLQHEQQAVRGHGAHPDGQRAQALRADDVGAAHVQREVERMHVAVVRAHAGLPEQARLGVLPQVEVLLREGAHRGDARGA